MIISQYERIAGPFIDTKYLVEFPRVTKLIEDKGGIPVTPFVNGYGEILPRGYYNQINHFIPPSTWTEPNIYYFFFRAFKSIMQKAVDDGIESLLFVEDDLDFLDGFDEVLTSGLKSLPDNWEMLYYSANNTWHTTEEVGPNLLRLNGSYCLQCVGIRGKKMIKRLANLPEVKGVDISIAGLIHPEGNCYSLFPNLAIQKPSRSTLVNMDVNYLEYFKSKGKNW